MTQAIRYKVLGSDSVYIAVRSLKCRKSEYTVGPASILLSCFAML